MGALARFTRPLDMEPLIKRRSERAVAYLCVDLCTETNFWTGLTMNISEGGLFVATHAVLPPGALVGLHLELPHHPTQILTLGEVRWSRSYSGNDDVPAGLGIQFVGLDLRTLEAIRHFISTTAYRIEPVRN